MCNVFIAYVRTHTRLTALFPRLPGWASTSRAKPDFTEEESEWQWHQLGKRTCTNKNAKVSHKKVNPIKQKERHGFCASAVITVHSQIKWYLKVKMNSNEETANKMPCRAPQIRSHDFWRYINLYVCIHVYVQHSNG